MMLASDELRVVLVTTHVPFRDVPALLTARAGDPDRADDDAGLRDWWGIREPRLALCAVNPHAGEGGLFGDEETRVLGARRRSRSARRARCRPTRSSSARCAASSTRCSRRITTWG